MDDLNPIDDLKREGRMRWLAAEQAWQARPDEVLDALARDGFQEYKREIARSGRDVNGGMWQGINTRTGAVASAVWIRGAPTDQATVYIVIDGRPLRDP